MIESIFFLSEMEGRQTGPNTIEWDFTKKDTEDSDEEESDESEYSDEDETEEADDTDDSEEENKNEIIMILII